MHNIVSYNELFVVLNEECAQFSHFKLFTVCTFFILCWTYKDHICIKISQVCTLHRPHMNESKNVSGPFVCLIAWFVPCKWFCCCYCIECMGQSKQSLGVAQNKETNSWHTHTHHIARTFCIILLQVLWTNEPHFS